MECSPSSVVQFQEESLAPFLPPLEKLTKKFKFHEHIERLGDLLLEIEEQGWQDPLSERLEIWMSSVLLGIQSDQIDSKQKRNQYLAKKIDKLFKKIMLSFLDRAPLESQNPRPLIDPVLMGPWTIERAVLEDWVSCQKALHPDLVIDEFQPHLIASALKNWAEECLLGLGYPNELEYEENSVAPYVKRYTKEEAEKKLKYYSKLAKKADFREAGRRDERVMADLKKELVLKEKLSQQRVTAEQANLGAMKEEFRQEIDNKIENLENRFKSIEEETKAREEKAVLEKKKIQEETQALIAEVQKRAEELHVQRKEELQNELLRLERTYIDEIDNLNLIVDASKKQISEIRSQHHEAVKENQIELLNNQIRLRNCEEKNEELAKRIIDLQLIHSSAQSRILEKLQRSEDRYNETVQSLESTKKVAANLQQRLNVTWASCVQQQNIINHNLAVQAHLQNQVVHLAHKTKKSKRFGIF